MWSNSQRQEYDFHRGWSILDVTDTADPRVLKFIEGPENTGTWQVDIADGLMITALDALSANWGGDPDAPHAPEAVLIWSLDDPLNPNQIGSFTTGGGTHRNSYFGGRYMHLAATSRGRALDYFCTHGGRFGPHNQNQLQHNPLVKNQDDLVYLTWFNAGLRIYDISTPIYPQEVGWFLPPDPRERRGPLPRKRSASMWKSVRTCSAARPGASPRCGMPSQCRKWCGTRDRGVVPSLLAITKG